MSLSGSGSVDVCQGKLKSIQSQELPIGPKERKGNRSELLTELDGITWEV